MFITLLQLRKTGDDPKPSTSSGHSSIEVGTSDDQQPVASQSGGGGDGPSGPKSRKSDEQDTSTIISTVSVTN
jgi:hypothetical protein